MGIDRSRHWWALLLGFGWTLAGAPASAEDVASAATVRELGQLSIEELANVAITSVTRTPQPLAQAPAAIYVITNDDIRRSGADSLPDALRLAPNLQVAQAAAGTYGITARGLNQATGTANKLLVMIDGRTVYSPLFSGVFWDAQNILLDDIDRIEVVSGPGGTLWGANAVNGVINVVTRSSAETQGALVDVRAGTLNRSVGARYGGTLGDGATYRVYAFGFDRGASRTLAGDNGRDSWENAQGGFRFDWSGARDLVTVQGDLYHGDSQDTPHEHDQPAIGGGNLLARWTRTLDGGATLTAQLYYDNAWRDLSSALRAAVDTYDFDAQYAFRWSTNDIVVGGGYRRTHDALIPGPNTAFLNPPSRTLDLANIFAQDSVAVSNSVRLTFGLKLENTTYTGLEYMPDARVAWQLSDDSLVWAAVSRAVRTPSRLDRDAYITGLLAGGPDFVSEKVIAYELGYRTQPIANLSLSVSTYYNVYSDLRTVEADPVTFTPFTVGNGMEGYGYGIEFWGTYALADWWRLVFGASVLNENLHLKPGSRDVGGIPLAGNDPNYQLSLRSSLNLWHGVEFDVDLRHVARLPDPLVAEYTAIDARIGWHLTPSLELALVGQNLNDASHQEFASPSLPRREISRSVYVSAVWRQ